MAGYKEGQRLVLFDLPDEVLFQIVEYFPRPHIRKRYLKKESSDNAIEAFRATCKKAFHLSDPLFWRCLSVRHLDEYNKIKAFLARYPLRPHYVRHLELIPAYLGSPRRDDKIQEIIALASILPNLERLSACPECYLKDEECKRLITRWAIALAFYFQSTNYNQLKYCYARLWTFLEGQQQSLILPLLNAPRLVELTLEAADLRDLRVDSIPKQSTALKKLKLIRCRLEEPALAALLGAPLSLASFEISLMSNHLSRPSIEREEYILILKAIKLLQRLQPNLTALGVTFQDGTALEDEISQGEFDLSRLRCLKELTLSARNTYFFRPFHERVEGPCLWFPVNGLCKLPAGLERIHILSETEDIDLVGLAEALLRHRDAGKTLPASLRLSCDVQSRHVRPLTEAMQNAEDRTLRALDIFMTQLSFLEIKYIMRWFEEVEDLEDEIVYSCTRTLVAERMAVANDVDDSAADPGTFELKDYTHSELEPFGMHLLPGEYLEGILSESESSDED
ncbi:uncharacterized protein PV07_08316 [Cladophialophora immunda]|uniref:F-box domain-containing protein n=1 Tax=Cladophialophora immunda TaxID=569365 RepID=A0A0D2CYL1_9EURO|nr:uncharacterized protein PV07_08316 [Cladophialophora immunda]KIW28674.1 hypothetical protein PV07_08316 [Cladophialophora immunda]